MERVYTDYTASGRQIVLNNVPASFASITVENIRLIFNETQKDSHGDAIDPLVSTGKKENLSSIVYNGTAHTVTLVLANNVPEIVGTDDLTIKIDMGDSIDDISIDTTSLAKEATLGSSPDTSVSTTVFGWLKSIRDFLVGIVTTNPYAKEATLGDVASVLDYIEQGGMPSITAIAKQGSNANATLSEVQAQATSAATDAAAAKTAAQAITGYALQGSNSAKTNTQLSSEIADIATLIGYTISEIDNA